MILKAKSICENISALKHSTGKVAGIYRHCFNILDDGGELMTVFGDTERYSTRAVICEYSGSMQELPIRDGMDVRLEPGKILLPSVRIDWSEAKRMDLHRDQLFANEKQREAAAGNIERNMKRVLEYIRGCGKKSPLLEEDSCIGKRAAAGIKRLKKDYMDGLGSLVGLGIGLTPSCDDLLGGMAGWMYLTGKEPAFLAALGSFLKEQGAVYTTAVSRNLLYDISCGIINDEIYDLIYEIINKGEQLERLTKRVIDYGSTSGMETCLGIVMGYHFQKDGE